MSQASQEISSTKTVEVIQHLHHYLKAGKLVRGAFTRTGEEVIPYILAAFDELSNGKLESVFLTVQAVMRLVLEHGGNNYVMPHLKKAAMRRASLLMSNVSCPVSLLL
ncbi:hypothetical protein H310_09795 [Aphanomyces invadans]|uniref:Uncharacterized protein n=1 Tax=Aphanomyces invadans TaxID=157072 RepID=A0A024TSE8_9STRA|nr:hypothetical protein H310_09795 [Aphanomyces invadans]ETV96933.1 hypothetical protein H310_09795 [Aphanomyces invadans]|eukprot:XP_008874179.1 hypothetical protein H310_09795 [Aphanomyces invadans]